MLSRTKRVCSSKSALVTCIVAVSTAARPDRKSRSPQRVAAERIGSLPPTGRPPIVIFSFGVMGGASTPWTRARQRALGLWTKIVEIGTRGRWPSPPPFATTRLHPVGGRGLGTEHLGGSAHVYKKRASALGDDSRFLAHRRRQRHDEPRPTGPALDGDLAVERLRQLLHDREAEAGADGAVRRVAAVE